MWAAQVEKKAKDVHRIKLFENQDQISYEDAIHYWRENYECYFSPSRAIRAGT